MALSDADRLDDTNAQDGKVRLIVSGSAYDHGLNAERRRRNRAIRAACAAVVTYAPDAAVSVVRNRRGRSVVRVEPRADVLAHADLVSAIRDARLTPAEERCFRRVMLGVDTAGRVIFHRDDAGRTYAGPMAIIDVAAEYDVPEKTVRRYVARALVKIRFALYGPDDAGLL